MKTYKVKALSVGGKNNKIFSHGDTVTEKQFPEGNAEKLAKEGFLEEIEVKVVTPSSNEDPEDKTVVDKNSKSEGGNPEDDKKNKNNKKK